MGGAVSCGKDNDDLVNKLIMAEYIKTTIIERVFRAVDRAEYFLPGTRGNAYDDIAWKCGNLHISAPCIYSEVMEGLDLKPAVSFLNLGSGTGYLSTMVGLVLGANGVNHGIELHADVIEYANKKVEDFKKLSGAIDEFDFCEPKFVQGNCLRLTSEFTMLYDRIYCGAACPEEYALFFKRLLKIDGVLVLPVNDQLLQIRRVSEAVWQTKPLLAVSFASLVLPQDGSLEHIKPIEVQPMSLQALCRTTIRNILRKNIEKEIPPPPPPKRRACATKTQRKQTPKRVVVPFPLPDDVDSSSSEDERQVILLPRYSNAGRRVFRREENGLLRFFMEIENIREEGVNTVREIWPPEEPRNGQEEMETDNNLSETDENQSGTDDNLSEENSISHQVHAVIEHHRHAEDILVRNENLEEDDVDVVNEDILDFLIRSREPDNLDEQVDNEIDDNGANGPIESASESEEQENGNENSLNDSDTEVAKPSTSTSAEASGSAAAPKSNTKREKFDSGLGDEIIEVASSSDEDEKENRRIDELCRGDMEAAVNKRGTRTNRLNRKFRRVESSRPLDSFSDTDDEEPNNDRDNEICMYKSPWTKHLTERIQKLPLPPMLKNFINYDREFPIDEKQE